MKRWQVIVHYFGPLATALGWRQQLIGEYRWRWVARLNAWMWNSAPLFGVPSFAIVSRKPAALRVVK